MLLFRCCFQSSKSVTKGGTKHNFSKFRGTKSDRCSTPNKTLCQMVYVTQVLLTCAKHWQSNNRVASCMVMYVTMSHNYIFAQGVPQFLNKGVTTVKTSLGLHKMISEKVRAWQGIKFMYTCKQTTSSKQLIIISYKHTAENIYANIVI